MIFLNFLFRAQDPVADPGFWLIHIGDFFKREASNFFLAPIGAGVLYSTIQIGDFPAIFSSENKNRLQTNGCCTHSSELFLFIVVGLKCFQLYCLHILQFKISRRSVKIV